MADWSISDFFSGLFGGASDAATNPGTYASAGTNAALGGNNPTPTDDKKGGSFWSTLIPALVTGGLTAGSSYLSNKNNGELSAAELKLKQDRFEFEKELALKQLAESGGGRALQAAIAKAQLEAQRQQLIQAAYQSAAQAALRAGEGSAANLNNVSDRMYRPFAR